MSDPKNEVLPIMLGTAGHVDHGKTSLVKQLTSFNTDTHKEELERGVSIDFGVAPFRLDEQRITGIIDVPGHIDFIRNMVAGITAIDVLMLVVAADDGVMPQTEEHMQIASIFGIKRVLVVLTKCDLVEQDLQDLAVLEVEEFLAGLGYSKVPVYRVSSETGDGIAQLREALIAELEQIPETSQQRPFRMFVRKAFSMKGFGTVVTGVPICGTVAEGEPLQLVPGDALYSIRAIQNYRSLVPEAKSHISCALNLRDVSPETFSRGMALVAPGTYRGQRSLLLLFENHSAQPFLGSKAVHVRLHAGTSAVPAKLFGNVAPGKTGFVELQLYKEVVLCPGDRVLLRGLSHSDTLGGGEVLACSPEPSRRFRDARQNEQIATAYKAGDVYAACFWSCPTPFVDLAAVRAYLQLDEASVQSEVSRRVKEGALLEVGKERWLYLERTEELCSTVAAILKRYHRRNPESLGIHDQHLAETLGIGKESFGKLWQHLQKTKQFQYEHSFVSLAEFSPSISKAEIQQQTRLLKLLAEAKGSSVARGTLKESLNIPEKELRKLLKRLQDANQIASIGNSVILIEDLARIESALITLCKQSAVLELKAFRDALQLSRNAAVEILEHFDAIGLTKRQGGGRVLARKL